MSYEYDVAISFAGEDREYVNVLAEEFRSRDLTVFYDEFEEGKLWGKNLYRHLQEVYRDRALFCVVVVSRHYVQKAWPQHELESAQERALFESEYILPVFLEDVDLPGLHRTISHLDAGKTPPDKIADYLVDKVNEAIEEENEENEEEYEDEEDVEEEEWEDE